MVHSPCPVFSTCPPAPEQDNTHGCPVSVTGSPVPIPASYHISVVSAAFAHPAPRALEVSTPSPTALVPGTWHQVCHSPAKGRACLRLSPTLRRKGQPPWPVPSVPLPNAEEPVTLLPPPPLSPPCWGSRPCVLTAALLPGPWALAPRPQPSSASSASVSWGHGTVGRQGLRDGHSSTTQLRGTRCRVGRLTASGDKLSQDLSCRAVLGTLGRGTGTGR